MNKLITIVMVVLLLVLLIAAAAYGGEYVQKEAEPFATISLTAEEAQACDEGGGCHLITRSRMLEIQRLLHELAKANNDCQPRKRV